MCIQCVWTELTDLGWYILPLIHRPVNLYNTLNSVLRKPEGVDPCRTLLSIKTGTL